MEYKLYTTSKTKVQLVGASLEDLKTQKNFDLTGEYITEIQFGTRMVVLSSTEVEAYLKTSVAVFQKDKDKDKDIPGVLIEVIYKGLFESYQDIHQSGLESWVDLQIVPQLLPYTRTLIATLTGLMDIKTINLPTIDILETMKVNDFPQFEEGVNDFE